jgi:hypothetical protein
MQSSPPASAQRASSCKVARQSCVWLVFAGLFLRLGLAAVSAADAIPASSPDLHIFTNQDGRTIKAEISSVAQDDVYLKREDGQSFKISVLTLSKDDQNYIRQWVIKKAQAHDDNILTIGITTVKTTPKPGVMPSVDVATITWSESYKIKVTNETSVHWTNLRVRYIIFRLNGILGAPPPNNFKPAHTLGDVVLDDLPGLQDKTVVTDKIDYVESGLAPGYSYPYGIPNKVADKMQGIWVRVYDEKNNLLQEWASSKEIMKDNNWDALQPPAPRGRRGAAPARSN